MMFIVLQLAVLFTLIAFSVRWAVSGGVRDAASKMGASGFGGGEDHSARRILDERYARGEINRDEYERMRRDIEAS